MKTKWMIIPVIALALGCSREIDTNITYINGEFTLYATSGENDTRTVLQQDGRVFWSPSDCITVFYGNVPGMFTSTNTEPAASAEFTGSLGSFAIDGETEFRAIYPHSNDIVTPTDAGILSIGLPWEQTGVEGTFADDLFICVAKSKDVNLHFYNVCGGVKFSLARDDIKKVVFRGNNGETLAGRMAVEFDSKGIPQVTDMTGGKSSVTLVAPDGGTFKEGAYYYLVLVPQSLTKGYTMELWTDELVETVSSEASVTVRRAAWGVLKGLGTTSPSIFIPEAIDLGLPSGLKWASFNLGASAAEEYGDHYAWGETEPYYSSMDPITWIEGKESGYYWPSYRWCMGDYNTLTKYCNDSSRGYNGFTDTKTVLDPEDDAAQVNLGGSWRMPTDAEWNELLENCTWTWTTQNGENGRLVTGSNGNSIFLPAAGLRSNANLFIAGSFGYYWSSSLGAGDQNNAKSVYLGSGDVGRDFGCRSYGLSIRPVYGDSAVSVESVSLDKTALELSVGESSTLTATVLPDNAMYKAVTWSSSHSWVATVSSSGVVAGVSSGSAVITVTTIDGDKTATCIVTVGDGSTTLPVPEMVDLGLSVKWASFNLGASKPEEYGNSYAWGETEPKEIYNWQNYKWCDDGDYTLLNKYNTESSCGTVDNKTFLDLEDDAAHVNLKSKWRMPTTEEQAELIEKCTWTWDVLNTVKGCWVTSTVNGNQIFLPAAGMIDIVDRKNAGSSGFYWSNGCLESWDPALAYNLFFNSVYQSVDSHGRSAGFSIRPIFDDSMIQVESVSLNKTELELSVGETSTLMATIFPENAANKGVSWSSSDETIATVSTTGVVSGVSVGSATITVTTSDGGKTATCQVTVEKEAIHIDDRGDVIVYTINGVELRMVRVEGGTFRMGSHHDVTLSTYYISDRPVSKRLFNAIVNGEDSGDNGLYLSTWTGKSSDILKINELLGANFHLPSEAQYEFAAKGGNYSHGFTYAGTNDSSLLTGSFPNELNLYGMSTGEEWVYDYCCAYPNTPVVDPVESVWKRNWPSGDWKNDTLMRVVRGSGSVETRRFLQPGHPNNQMAHRLVFDTTNDASWKNGDYVGDYR